MQKSKESITKMKKQRPSMQIVNSEAQKIRIYRHQRLIQMIHQYHRTIQQQDKLHRMRIKTAMEIDMRFKMSLQNKHYIFPRDLQNNNDDQNDDELKSLSRNVYYDLRSQNQLIRLPSQSQFLQISRRVKSLDQVGIKSQRVIKKVGRIETDLDIQHYKLDLKSKLKRSKTVKKQGLNQVILPVLGKKLENLKTENTQPTKTRVQNLIQKKLITQAYAPFQMNTMKVNWKFSKKR